MAKTVKSAASVEAFIARIEDKQKRADSTSLAGLMTEVTGEEPKMWGSSIVGFGSRHYKYESGTEGDTMVVGFSPRKAALTLYGLSLGDRGDLLDKLGPHQQGKGCLYIKRLSDIDVGVLKKMIKQGFKSNSQPNP